MFAIIAIFVIIILAAFILCKDTSGFSKQEVKEMNEMIEKGLTPTDRFSNIIQHQVDKGIQEIRKQVSADVAKVRKMIENS